MTERLFGVETEYALTATDARGGRASQEHAIDGILRETRRAFAYLPDEHAHGMFLQNGARFYVDCGGHPEMTTPECTNPWDVVRYIRAGEAILLAGAARRMAGRAGGQIAIYRSNVDYSGSRSSWGCHESLMHRADPADLPAQMIPHLVSRIVFTGAGGFSNASPGIAFTLSPRSVHIVRDVSCDSTGKRGIFHEKDEPLTRNGAHRLHVIFGESLCSDLACWLKMGTTALVLAMCEAGLRPGDAVALRSPVGAMQRFASDTTCTAGVHTASGGGWTAVAIQRHYLELAERHRGARFMPSWAGAVCRRWRSVLDRLSEGPHTVAFSLDWAIKRSLYEQHARRRGFAWESLGAWNRVMEALTPALARVRPPIRRLTTEVLLGTDSPIGEDVNRLTPLVYDAGLDWRGVEPFLSLRDELFEIDTRFGQLGEGGIFTALDASGALDHRVEGVDAIEQAIEAPPRHGRAQVRGRLVRELTGHDPRYRCDWQSIWDVETGKRIDLSDPFATSGSWTDPPPALEDPIGIPRSFLEGVDERLRLLRLRERLGLTTRRRRSATGE